MAHNPQLKSCSMKQIVSLLWDSIDYDPIDRIEQHGKVSQLIGKEKYPFTFHFIAIKFLNVFKLFFLAML